MIHSNADNMPLQAPVVPSATPAPVPLLILAWEPTSQSGHAMNQEGLLNICDDHVMLVRQKWTAHR